MSSDIILWLEFLLLPPGLLIPFAVLGLLQFRKRKRFAIALILSGIGLTLILAMPKVARSLISDLQTYPPINLTEVEFDKETTAIVVLGGGRYPNAPEYQDQDQVSPATLERLRYAAVLKKELGLPMVLSGGRRNADATPEAVMMNKVLVDEYAVEPEYLEVHAANTREQAMQVEFLLSDTNINRVVLITHAWHMPRAVEEFKVSGLNVVPAPMGFMATANQRVNYIPSAAAMQISARALHESYARIWLNLTYGKPAAKPLEPVQTEPQEDPDS